VRVSTKSSADYAFVVKISTLTSSLLLTASSCNVAYSRVSSLTSLVLSSIVSSLTSLLSYYSTVASLNSSPLLSPSYDSSAV